jgi:DNA mismatch repair protein MutL
MAIRRLTAETIGKIAAGEVIERPAAAIKELIENALDAGATRIDIAIADGGVSALEVRDDGCGISWQDLPLAVERHATSKIAALEDLDGLHTLGFRGEALASLAAVSRLRIRTMAQDDSAGGELAISFGAVAVPRQIAWGVGTAIEARDLFENLPARRKFLRQPATEAGYIGRVAGAYALAYPSVAFSLEIDGRRTFATDGRGDPLSAAAGVLGAETAEQLLVLDAGTDVPEGYGITGVVSLPTIDRATRQQQFVFAQGRLVTNRQVATAFEQAYHSLLMVGRHPIGCLCITVPPGRVDVNVHPTKSEVRFADERLIFGLVQRAVRGTLLGATQNQPIPTIVSAPLGDMQVQRRMSLAHPQVVSRQQEQPLSAWDAPLVHPPESFAGGRRLPLLRVLGQVASTFIVAEGPDGMYLIDQHAAHERIMFERLFAQYQAREPRQQMLLEPVTVELGPRAWETFVSSRDELLGLGFDVEEFGAPAVAVRAVPASLKVRDAGGTLVTILEEIAQGGRGDTLAESLAISAACHTSIRAGQALSLIEMRELVEQLEACSSPQACGHGRPTMLRMTAEDLERQFARG